MPLYFGIAFKTKKLNLKTGVMMPAYQVWDEEWIYLNIPNTPKDKLKALIDFVKSKNAWRVDVSPGLYEEWKWKSFPINQRRQD